MIDIPTLIQSFGYLGLFGIIFLESGIIIGSFFPGDSLIFTAGILSSHGLLSLPVVIAGIFVAAVAGNSIGYFTGKYFGPKIFKREDSIFFHKKHMERAENFYQEYGTKTIVLARFMPIVRTFAPIIAGVGRMPYKKFLTYNLIGGALWSVGITGLGYALGNIIPNIDRYLLPIIALIIIVSLIPTVREYYKSKS